MDEGELIRAQRWRLTLGPESDDALGPCLDETGRGRDRVLAFLYDREYGPGRNTRRSGSLDPSSISVPEWINQASELFPTESLERLERDALERYELAQMLADPEVLSRAQPSMSLLEAVLRTKNLMNAEVLSQAKRMVAKVVEELMKKLSAEVRAPFSGTRDKNRRSFAKVSRNFDPRRTIGLNLKHWDPVAKRMLLEELYFNSRVRRRADKWRIIILVDESGSMASSVIHAAVTASVFWGIKALDSRLIIFDTAVVDLSDYCSDPVETLMKVQLGGGTDIGAALGYALGLIEDPRRTMVVLISDFAEGGPERIMLERARAIVEGGSKLLGLAALDDKAMPCYDRRMAENLVRLGAEVGAMTPGQLARWVGEKIR